MPSIFQNLAVKVFLQKSLVLYLILGSILGCPSCKKYLDAKSDASLTVPTTADDLQGILDYTTAMNLSTPGYGEASSDNYFMLDNTYNSRGERDQMTYQWKPSVSEFSTDWSRSYLAIYNSNLCLEQVQKIESQASDGRIRNIKGSAFFFRAYYFSQLSWIYAKAYDEATAEADLGIVLRLTSDYNAASERSSVKETYRQIVDDAKKAISFLPELSEVATRPSKQAAYALLARVFLSMRNYEQAYLYADSSLQLKHQLLDYNDANEVTLDANAPFSRLNKETMFYTQMNNYYAAVNPVIGLVDTTLFNSYDDNDLRKVAFFRPRAGYQQFKGMYTQNSFIQFSGIATDEMYLTRAECHARLNRVEDALADLNKLLEMRWSDSATFVPVAAVDAQEALNVILIERRKELLFRGLRWMDIKRLNKEKANIVVTRKISGQIVTLQPNDKRYALPIPADIIRITGIPQN